METHSIKRLTLPTTLASILLLFAAAFIWSDKTYAGPPQLKPPQVAWHHPPPAGVYYYRPGYMYYGPRHGTFWGGWSPYYNHGMLCQRSCLVDRWSGTPIRCVSRCLYE
ncbi:hypothetical protein ACFORL_09745 [Legionella dresdenensis]|uniref:Uncharacterized protein n=1 Tax=Legionella dresdenensis TaxID=450200 RepID=A0ABV8CH91_9GAMM